MRNFMFSIIFSSIAFAAACGGIEETENLPRYVSGPCGQEHRFDLVSELDETERREYHPDETITLHLQMWACSNVKVSTLRFVSYDQVIDDYEIATGEGSRRSDQGAISMDLALSYPSRWDLPTEWSAEFLINAHIRNDARRNILYSIQLLPREGDIQYSDSPNERQPVWYVSNNVDVPVL